MKKDKKEDFEKDWDKMKAENLQSRKQMKENSNLMKALKVTMQAQSIARGVISNPSAHFNNSKRAPRDEIDDADNENEGNTMDEAVEDTVTTNDNVESYNSITFFCNNLPHTILARCKNLSITLGQEYTVVDRMIAPHLNTSLRI